MINVNLKIQFVDCSSSSQLFLSKGKSPVPVVEEAWEAIVVVPEVVVPESIVPESVAVESAVVSPAAVEVLKALSAVVEVAEPLGLGLRVGRPKGKSMSFVLIQRQ